MNISSCSGVFICHGGGTYSPSKVMLDIYSRTMSIENRDKVDVISVRPFGVKTPMMDMKKGVYMITPQDCVVSSLADLGVADVTWTGFKHKVQASFFEQFTEEQTLEIFDKLFTFKKS